jgi:hypothetical protein
LGRGGRRFESGQPDHVTLIAAHLLPCRFSAASGQWQ